LHCWIDSVHSTAISKIIGYCLYPDSGYPVMM
jgi:hypothetical protein